MITDLKVLKFGGTSVGSAQRIKNVARLITECSQCGGEPRRAVVVLSAMAGTTNSLVEINDYLAKGNTLGAMETVYDLERRYRQTVEELFAHSEAHIAEAHAEIDVNFAYLRSFNAADHDEVDAREILAQGELMSVKLMRLYLQSMGIEAAAIPALDYMRITELKEPDMDAITELLLPRLDAVNDAQVILTEGFICRNNLGEIDNLQRGGSDYTASLVGAVAGASEVQIWTDIDGMHNNDPRFVDNTKAVSELSFEEAAELAYFGAKILHPTCVLPAKLAGIPVRLLNTLDPSAPGTLITANASTAPGQVKAIAAKDGVVALKILSSRMTLNYHFMHDVFAAFHRLRTSIDTMATSEVGVTVTISDTTRLPEIVEQLKHYGAVTVDTDMAVICIVGDMDWHRCTPLHGRILHALADIPVRLISYGGSNHNISVLVCGSDKVAALRALSAELFAENSPKNE